MPSTNELHNRTVGYGVAAAVAILCNTALTWVKEKNPAVNLWMKNLLGHHWITHGVLIVLLFLVLGFLLSKMIKKMNATALTVLLVVSTAAGAIGLIALFLFD